MAATEDTMQGPSASSLRHQCMVPKHLALFHFIQSVVVGGDASVIHLVKTDYDGIADAALIDRDDLADFPVPVRLRSHNAHLQDVICSQVSCLMSSEKEPF